MSAAWQQYDAYTADDGKIVAHVSTNDDADTGYPSTFAEWDSTWRNRAAFLKSVSGGSHYGCSGVRVFVFLDGQEVKA